MLFLVRNHLDLCPNITLRDSYIPLGFKYEYWELNLYSNPIYRNQYSSRRQMLLVAMNLGGGGGSLSVSFPLIDPKP
jgi:hypothetical protein